MGLKKLTGKVSDFNERLEAGKANKVQPADVEKVLRKLRAKADEITEDLDAATHPDHKSRLNRKLLIARQQIERAAWLLRQLD